MTVKQVEDVDGSAESTGPLVRIEEPPGWTEDYTLDEAEALAALLQQARRLVTWAAQ